MSLTSFIAKLWSSIQSLFNSFPSSIKTAVHVGVTITENIKHFVDSPVVDVLTALIPGDVDDKIKLLLRENLPQILDSLKLADGCGESTDPQYIVKCVIQTLQNLEGEIKSAFLHSLSVLLTQLVADSQLSWSDGVCVVEWYYQNQYKKAA